MLALIRSARPALGGRSVAPTAAMAMHASKRFMSAEAAEFIEVGQLIDQQDKPYDVGTLFVHRTLGYRGIIADTILLESFEGAKLDHVPPRQRGRKKPIYSALVDRHDIKKRNELDPILAGIGIPHADILPYTTSQPNPIANGKVAKFFSTVKEVGKPMQFQPTAQLNTYQKDLKNMLAYSRVHTMTTENVKITMMPLFSHSTNAINTVYEWHYIVNMEHLGGPAVTLQNRTWEIRQAGRLNNPETFKGRGVVGKFPRLSKESPGFRYSSRVSLPTSYGSMLGTYEFMSDTGDVFDIVVPEIFLESPRATETARS
eukprot:Clim_evm115s172 gene=Clim_evmTU115s172